MAGIMSVPRSIAKMRKVVNGSGIANTMNAKNGVISGILLCIVYVIDFFRLSKIKRPSSTPLTIEAKLSSRRIMSAAFFDTSPNHVGGGDDDGNDFFGNDGGVCELTEFNEWVGKLKIFIKKHSLPMIPMAMPSISV